MATKPLTVEQCREALDILARCGNMTSHLHSPKVNPITNARGTLYGVDTGTLADVNSDAFVEYTEDNVKDWRSGFAVLTFRNGRLLHPELCLVHSEDAGIVEFRGEEFVV